MVNARVLILLPLLWTSTVLAAGEPQPVDRLYSSDDYQQTQTVLAVGYRHNLLWEAKLVKRELSPVQPAPSEPAVSIPMIRSILSPQ